MSMTAEAFVSTYGYAALFVGTFLEGEFILVIGGVLAHSGHLELFWVIIAAFLGSLSGDQFYFFMGRLKGRQILARKPRWKARADRVEEMLHRYRAIFLMGFRFVYGIRTATPFAVGMSSVPTLYFLTLNTAGALLWAAAIGSGGYFFGAALEALLRDIERYEMWAALAIASLALAAWAGHFLWKRRAGG